jgi:hypothetical protein
MRLPRRDNRKESKFVAPLDFEGMKGPPKEPVFPKGWKPPGAGNIVTPEELAELTDDELVELILERTTLGDPLSAREALAVIRGEIPEGKTF